MMRGDELAVAALKKEHKRLAYLADRYKREADEACNIGREFVAIHNEFAAIVNAKRTDHQAVVNELEALQKRRTAAARIMKKDLVKLLDKQYKAESDAADIFSQIQQIEWRLQLKRK